MPTLLCYEFLATFYVSDDNLLGFDMACVSYATAFRSNVPFPLSDKI